MERSEEQQVVKQIMVILEKKFDTENQIIIHNRISSLVSKNSNDDELASSLIR